MLLDWKFSFPSKTLSDDFLALKSSAKRAITRPVNRGLSQTTFASGEGEVIGKQPKPREDGGMKVRFGWEMNN